MPKKNPKKKHGQQSPNKKVNAHKRIYIGAVLTVLIAAAVAAVLLIQNKQKNNPVSGTDQSSVNVVCAILYPALQENGEIWSTGGMQELEGTTLREALEKDFADIFSVTFAEDGKLASLGEIHSGGGYRFIVYKNTPSGRVDLGEIPETILLEEACTYDICLIGPDGQAVNHYTDQIREATGAAKAAE